MEYMEKRKRALVRCLKAIDEESLRRLCRMVQLTKTEEEIIVMSYSRMQDASFVADTCFMGIDNLYKRKTIANRKIMFWLDVRMEYENETNLIQELCKILSLKQISIEP